MPVAQPSPTEIIIYVKPYVRKYVLARLSDPTRTATDHASRELHMRLERELSGRKLLGVVNDFVPHQDDGNTRLRLVVQRRNGQNADISYYQHRYVSGMLTKAFLGEMYGWVDWYRSRLGMGTRAALITFRGHYSISDTDQALDTAERMYRFHLKPRKKSKARVRRR